MAMDRFPSNILDFIKKYRKKVKEILGIEGPEYSPEDVSNKDVDALFDGGGGGGSSSSSEESGSGEDPSIMTDQLFEDLVSDFTGGENSAIIRLTPDADDLLGSVSYNGFSGISGFTHGRESVWGYSGYLLYFDTQLVGIVLQFSGDLHEDESWILYPADSTGIWEGSEYKLTIQQNYLALASGASFGSNDIPVLRDNDYISGTKNINLWDSGSDFLDAYKFQ